MAFSLMNMVANAGAARVLFVALALSVTTPGVRAEDCLDITSTAAVPDFAPCESDEPQLDLDAILASQAMSISATPSSDGTPWIAQGSKDVPLTVNSSDTGVSLRTSLATFRDHSIRDATMAIDPATPASPSSFVLPKAPAAPKSPLDIWSSVDLQGPQSAGGESMRAGVGADYKINRATTVGVTAERAAGSDLDSKMAAYVTLRAAPMLTLDARTEWQAGNADFAATTGAAEVSTFSLAPRIDHSFALSDGKTIEPFLTYKREFDLNERGLAEGTAGLIATDSAGAGVTFTNPDSYSLSVTTAVEGLGASQAESLNSKLQLKVPIK